MARIKYYRGFPILYDKPMTFTGRLLGSDRRFTRRHVFKRGTLLIALPACTIRGQAFPHGLVGIVHPKGATWIRQ